MQIYYFRSIYRFILVPCTLTYNPSNHNFALACCHYGASLFVGRTHVGPKPISSSSSSTAAESFIMKSRNSQVLLMRLCQVVFHIVALPFTLKSILRQKKNYGNSNISPCKNIIFKKSFKRNQNLSRYYNSITNLKFNTSQNIVFQKSSYKNRPIIITW
jgi:hypothetical protein